MTEYFQSKHWAISGYLEQTRKTATARLKERGATVATSVTSKTDFLVSTFYDPNDPDYLSNKEIAALRYDIPIFNEAQFLAILDGASQDKIEALAHTRHEPEVIPTRDALEDFRDLVYGALDEEKWEAICGLVDQCEETALPVVLDYLGGNLDQLASTHKEDVSEHHLRRDGTEHIDPRGLIPRWRLEVLRGLDHPKLSLVRVADLRGQGVNGKLGEKLLSCSHLSGLVAMSLDNNKAPMKLWKAIAEAPQFSGLTLLGIGESKINARCAESLSKATFSDNLTHLLLGETTFQRDALAALFGDEDAWPKLTFLQAKGTVSLATDIHTALADATHLGGLTHLVWSNIEGSDEGFEQMIRAPHLSNLRALDLCQRNLSQTRLDALASATQLHNLQHLVLLNGFFTWRNQPLPDLGEVLRAPQFATLRTLSLTLNTQGLETLSAASHLSQLRNLYIDSNRLNPEAWTGLLKAPHLSGLSSFTTSGPLPEGFIGRLMGSDAMPGLKSFVSHHHSTRLLDKDLRTLIGATHRAGLSSLDINIDDTVSSDLIRASMSASHLPTDLKTTLSWELEKRHGEVS